MKGKRISAVLAALAALTANAQNPFVQTWFTSDPAPMVHNGRMYVYTGHDEDNADFFWMQEWRVYSTSDMVNWQDHGSPLALESFLLCCLSGTALHKKDPRGTRRPEVG